MTFGSKPKSSKFVDWKSTLILVIPAEAGIQAPYAQTNLDAGPEFILSASKDRHDELSLRLKARDFTYPRERH